MSFKTPKSTNHGLTPLIDCLKEDQENRASRTPKTLAALEKELLESVERLDRGEGVEGEAVMGRLRKHMTAGTSGE